MSKTKYVCLRCDDYITRGEKEQESKLSKEKMYCNPCIDIMDDTFIERVIEDGNKPLLVNETITSYELWEHGLTGQYLLSDLHE